MIPMHFGSRRQALFGMFEPATSPRANRAVLILNPGGWEYIRAYRSLKVLAERLGRAGCDVLRFDYRGTGESWGDMADVKSVDDWLDDAELALDELLALATSRTLSVVGLRLGASLVPELFRRRPREIDRLVLWEPLEDLDALSGSDPTPLGSRPALAVPAAILQGLASGNSQVVVHKRVRLLVATSGLESPEAVRIPAGQLTTVSLPDLPQCWVEESDFGAGAVPVPMIDRISEWLVN